MVHMYTLLEFKKCILWQRCILTSSHAPSILYPLMNNFWSLFLRFFHYQAPFISRFPVSCTWPRDSVTCIFTSCIPVTCTFHSCIVVKKLLKINQQASSVAYYCKYILKSANYLHMYSLLHYFGSYNAFFGKGAYWHLVMCPVFITHLWIIPDHLFLCVSLTMHLYLLYPCNMYL